MAHDKVSTQIHDVDSKQTCFENTVSQRDLHDDEIEDEIREAFRCFDKEGHGFIPVTGTVIRLAIFKLSTKFY